MLAQEIASRTQVPIELAVQALHYLVVTQGHGLTVDAIEQTLGFVEIHQHLPECAQVVFVVHGGAAAQWHDVDCTDSPTGFS